VILLAPIVLQAQAAVFAPPLELPFRVVTERVQEVEGSRTVFRVERLVRFVRDGIGYRAEVRVLASEADPSADASAMMDAGASGLTGRTIVFRLDGAGRIVAIDDREAVWTSFRQGIARIFAARKRETPADRAQLAERIAAPLAAIPVERQVEILGSLVDVLIVGEAVAPHAARPIRLPARSPLGGTQTLEGTRSIAPAGPLLRIATRASGKNIAMTVERDADPRTGLLASSTETVETRTGARSSTRVSTTRVEQLPLEAWSW
jgi:hypothetical protein